MLKNRQASYDSRTKESQSYLKSVPVTVTLGTADRFGVHSGHAKQSRWCCNGHIQRVANSENGAHFFLTDL